MPRKQTRQPSRKRLWFNVVEFDKETGRPLWRNKKTKLENDIPPCITDPTFTALLEKLREETEAALSMNLAANDNTAMPCSMVWRNNKPGFKPSEPRAMPTQQHFNYRNAPRYESEPASPKLVMQFQHFSPLTSENDSLDVQQQKRQIKDFLKMKPMQYGQDYQGLPHFDDSVKNASRNCYSNSDAYVPDADVLASDWENTVRLHHMDFDNKHCMYENSCDFNSDQKVPLAIF